MSNTTRLEIYRERLESAAINTLQGAAVFALLFGLSGDTALAQDKSIGQAEPEPVVVSPETVETKILGTIDVSKYDSRFTPVTNAQGEVTGYQVSFNGQIYTFSHFYLGEINGQLAITGYDEGYTLPPTWLKQGLLANMRERKGILDPIDVTQLTPEQLQEAEFLFGYGVGGLIVSQAYAGE